MARFRIARTFHLKSKRQYVLLGDIENGRVRAGMTIHLPGPRNTVTEAELCAVESAYAGPDGEDYLGLCIAYADNKELRKLQDLNLPGEIVELTES